MVRDKVHVRWESQGAVLVIPAGQSLPNVKHEIDRLLADMGAVKVMRLEVAEMLSDASIPPSTDVELIPPPDLEQPRQTRPSVATRAGSVFDYFAILAPRDVYEEEAGDALELLERMEQQGRPAWQMWLKVASTIFWVTINGLRHIAAAALGKAKPGRK